MTQLIAQISPRSMTLLLLIGMGSFAAGILLMIHHRRQWLTCLATEKSPRQIRFEDKKFKRRAFIAALISALGTVMISTYWVVEQRTFALMIGLMFLILVSMLILASLDLLSVGLHEFSKQDESARKALVKKHVELLEQKKREAKAKEITENEPPPSTDP